MTHEQKLYVLESIKALDAEIKLKQREIDELRAGLDGVGGIDYAAVKVQSSGTGDRLGGAVVRVLELENDLERMQEQYIALRRSVLACIGFLADPMERCILTARYVDRLTWRAVGDLFKPRLSRQWLNKRRNDAIEHLTLDNVIFKNLCLQGKCDKI